MARAPSSVDKLLSFSSSSSSNSSSSSISISSSSSSSSSFVLVILNQKLPQWAPLLWSRAQLRICADGGANRLYNAVPSPERFVPDFIVGDLDSIEPDVKEFYSSKGAEIVDKSHDQDTTDLHKCVDFVRTVHKNELQIFVLGALGGRFDHEMGNLNVLYSFPDLRIVLLSDENLIFLLQKGCLEKLQAIPGAHCGLIPLGCPSLETTTTGLKWNLDALPMSFGTLVSTSNIVESETVTVLSDVNLLWTMTVTIASS